MSDMAESERAEASRMASVVVMKMGRWSSGGRSSVRRGLAR